MDEGQIHRGRGLVDLIAGVTPTLVDWTNDPTDAADITDGDISTFCTTGNKICTAGYQYAFFEWDLGAFYNVLCGGVCAINATAGTPRMYLNFWDGSNWVRGFSNFSLGGTLSVGEAHCARCSKVRLSLTTSASATITPNIREFHAWRL